MLDTKKPEQTPSAARRRSRGPVIAATAFAAIVLIGAVIGVLANLGDDAEPQPAAPASTAVVETTVPPESEAPTTTALSGPALQGASGVIGLTAGVIDGPGTEPDTIKFNDDGTFEVVDQFRTVDTGVYTTDGDVITFESDPTEFVEWFYDPINTLGRSDCAGVVGSYTVVWETSTRFVLDVIGDGCPRRIGVANNLELELELP